MSQISPSLSKLIREMPKAELHIHLEGAIDPKTVLRLADRNDKLDILPGTKESQLRDWFTFTDFPHFLEVYITIIKLMRSADDIALVAYENGADMAAQNIRYRELTVTPNMHTVDEDKGMRFEELLEGLEEGRQRAHRDFGVEMRWVFDCSRTLSFPNRENGSYDPRPAKRTLAYALAGRDVGVIGLGLGGYEVGAPPEPFADVFASAKEAGLLSVPHAGETVGPSSIWGAIDALQADRVGHGVRSIEDPRLLQALKDRQIPLELSLTSNERLHVFNSVKTHPFPHLDRMGLSVTVNSDDPPLFNTTLCQEYEILANEFGYTMPDIARVARNAFAVSGTNGDLRKSLLDEFDTWVTGNVTDVRPD